MARICLQQFFTVCVWVYKQVWNPTHTLPCLLVLHSCLVGEHATISQSFAQLRPRKQTARTWKTQWFHVQVPPSVPWYSYLRDQIYADIVGRHECQWVINCYLFWAPGRWSSTFMGMGGWVMLVVCQVRNPHPTLKANQHNQPLLEHRLNCFNVAHVFSIVSVLFKFIVCGNLIQGFWYSFHWTSTNYTIMLLVSRKAWVGRKCQGVCMALHDLTIHDQHYTSLISFHAFCSITLSNPTRSKVLGAMLVCFGEPDYLREVVKCKAVPGTDSWYAMFTKSSNKFDSGKLQRWRFEVF